MQVNLWMHLLNWPLPAKYLYLWSFTNEHVDGLTGIGLVPDQQARHETGLPPKQIAAAWDFLAEKGKVMRLGDWYWVVTRTRHVCVNTDGGPNEKLVPAVRDRMRDPSIPQEIKQGWLQLYAPLLDALSIEHPYPMDTTGEGYPTDTSRARTPFVSRRSYVVGRKSEEEGTARADASASAPAAQTIPYIQIAKRWNEWAKPVGLSLVRPQNISDGRQRRMKVTWHAWRKYDQAGDPWATLQAILAKIEASEYLRGGQSWFDFWWLFAGDRAGNPNWLKILEGKYAKRFGNGREKQQPQDAGATPDGFTV